LVIKRIPRLPRINAGLLREMKKKRTDFKKRIKRNARKNKM